MSGRLVITKIKNNPLTFFKNFFLFIWNPIYQTSLVYGVKKKFRYHKNMSFKTTRRSYNLNTVMECKVITKIPYKDNKFLHHSSIFMSINLLLIIKRILDVEILHRKTFDVLFPRKNFLWQISFKILKFQNYHFVLSYKVQRLRFLRSYFLS